MLPLSLAMAYMWFCISLTRKRKMGFWERDAHQWRQLTYDEVMHLREQRMSHLAVAGSVVLA